MSLIFGRDSVSKAINIKWGLCSFEAWSGPRINFSKSFFICLGSKNLTINLIFEIFRCKEEQFPMKYLGIPIKPEKFFKQDWNPLLDCFEKKLESWKDNLLSLGGRVGMLNAVLSTLPLYYISFFLLLCWVRNIIDRIRKNFMWNSTSDTNKYHIVP